MPIFDTNEANTNEVNTNESAERYSYELNEFKKQKTLIGQGVFWPNSPSENPNYF